ncbi:hypothetical protein [Massilia sp. S19_KUP03_FR1]|uniref:hypothetical protein n=1 Tax=Massilia sp. S19_KUP03_FR1 TaxID=3025503 RepID=UPI002FCD7C9E
MGAGEKGLSGSWTHSYEEDTGNEQVYRPDSYAFPPSRRPRARLDFGAGQVTTAVPGPDDKLQRSTAPITALGMNRFRLGDGPEIEVIEARTDTLRVRST